MQNITVQLQIAGAEHTVEFLPFRCGDYFIYQVCGSTLPDLPEGVRFTEVTHFSKQLTKPHESLQIDPRIPPGKPRLVYFAVYLALLQEIDRTTIGFTSSIPTAEDYL